MISYIPRALTHLLTAASMGVEFDLVFLLLPSIIADFTTAIVDDGDFVLFSFHQIICRQVDKENKGKDEDKF